ncbi:hypothetical protein NDU88_006284 [Pleurodeles waltl]|uniref:Uncharacterized protein n=1 Tax=Pleurodeles waltl TaxID=8319 RepID=A0AAV7SP62_PLEWA|nr:hypothetical protein NDU88_006284 [Pleurodeles waltl]
MWGRGQGSGDGARLISPLRRGRLKIEEKRAISGPIRAHTEVLDWGPILGAVGAPWRPRRVLASGPGSAIGEETGGPSSRLKPQPRVEPRAGAGRGRTAREQRGTLVESPRCSGGAGVAGGGPGARERIRPVGRRSSAAAGCGRGRGPRLCWARPANTTPGTGGALKQ